MRTRVVLALAVLLAAMTASCAESAADDPGVATAQSAGPAASSSASARSGPDPDAMIKYSRCMREQGLSWFPDPEADGTLQVRTPDGADQNKIKKAEEACKTLLPAGDKKDRATPQQIEQARRMARCMRENGVPNFPDPGPDGEVSVDAGKLGTGPGDPAFDKAEKACSQYLPPGASRHESTPEEATA